MGEPRQLLSRVAISDPMAPATYAPLWGTDGEVMGAIVCCGRCGKMQSLTEHTVEPDGIVNPAISCCLGCGWEVWARFAGWREGPVNGGGTNGAAHPPADRTAPN
jgi:hypothetical protein